MRSRSSKGREIMDIGTMKLSPGRAIKAGSNVTLRLTYRAGHPVDDTGYVLIAMRFASDCGAFQFDDPRAPNYCRVSTDGDCLIVPRWDAKGFTRPWGSCLYLQVRNGYLDRGEKITVIIGDTSKGSPGWQVQTFCESTFEFKTLVDPIATYQFQELPSSPTVKIVPNTPSKAVCIAPSQAAPGQAFSYYLKIEDAWGNPVRKPKKLRHRGFAKPGVHTIQARDATTKLKASSNPIEVTVDRSQPNRYWADIHGQSEETIGTNSIEDYFTFARDFALLDIAAHQGNDFQISDTFWKKINRVTKNFNESGRFVTFPGYEWSGNTPLGGDRNVWFKKEGGEITRSCGLLAGKTKGGSQTANDLFRKVRGPSPFIHAHVGGRYADLKYHDNRLETAVEIHSAWGTFEWMLADAFRYRYRVGICANSDGHKGRPGASYPGAGKFGAYGGLTCYLADGLNRDAIFNAEKALHFYATTGNRSILWVEAVQENGKRLIMGDTGKVPKGAVRLEGNAVGTGPIDNVEVRMGMDVLTTLRPFGRHDLGRRIKVLWSGSERRGRGRAVSWDGGLKVKGNRIESFEPINFWNPVRKIERVSKHELRWSSVTTGGCAGVILKLAEPDKGTLEMETNQLGLQVGIHRIGLKPQTWPCGGLEKKIQAWRLPEKQMTNTFSFAVTLSPMRKKYNPVYVRVMQEDGHMAWSSPIYFMK